MLIVVEIKINNSNTSLNWWLHFNNFQGLFKKLNATQLYNNTSV